jgi:hypothetical protein
MQTRKEDNYCPVTVGMWKNAISCTEEVNKAFTDCIDKSSIFCLTMVSGGVAPLAFFASWLICCGTPPVVAVAATPVTGLIDCCMFSTKKIGQGINKCSEGPEQQLMEDNSYWSKKYGDL